MDASGNPIAGLAEFSNPESPTGAPLAGLAEYTGGEVVTRRPVNTTGDGTIITIGLESDINGFPLSLQEINVLALKGKIL